MRNLPFIVILLLITSCIGKDCKELPEKFSSYEEATEEVLNSNFKIEQKAYVGNSSILKSAEYFSCNGSTGYLIIALNNRDYIFQQVPYTIWQGLRQAESKGGYYNKFIRGKYRLDLNNEVIF